MVGGLAKMWQYLLGGFGCYTCHTMLHSAHTRLVKCVVLRCTCAVMEWQVTEIATKTFALAESALWIFFTNGQLDCIKNSLTCKNKS